MASRWRAGVEEWACKGRNGRERKWKNSEPGVYEPTLRFRSLNFGKKYRLIVRYIR